MGKLYAAVSFNLRNLKISRLQIFLASEKSEKTMWVGIRYILNEIYTHKSVGSGRHGMKMGINNDVLRGSQKEIRCLFACGPLSVRRM